MNDFFEEADREKELGRGSACTWWTLLLLVIAITVIGAILLGRIVW